ncbi:MAG TPA: cytochrome c-type biogenesis CcmF C-terminal domain-containing protein [bacterium]|nr:cytochrome c-type biogenesis CcmF C-terminal domain-containing protein [bacterium]
MNSSLSFFGSHLLALAYPVTLFSLLIYLAGARRRMRGLVVAGQRATWIAFFLITAAVLTLVWGFLSDDFGILYVASYSSRSLPFFFKLTGLWAGLDGSILFWTWLVSLYGVVVLRQNRDKHPEWMPWINATLMGIVFFFLTLILFANNPFVPLVPAPQDGKGLNPLLQNIAMVVHPPSLYLGFTGFSVPFAFVIAALVTRKLDAVWIEATRRWILVSWLFLTVGLILGGAWAYVELGWGGFWAWDPVENAALMPWLVATAYLHSVMIQKKRGMLMVWNVVLIVLTYLMTIVGTYLTRSGVVQSVHAFSGSKLGPYFLLFLGSTLLFCVGLIVTRLPELKGQNTLQSYISKESAFLINNVVLLVAAFTVLWGTLFPTLSEAVTGDRISVGPPFFNKIMGPVALTLLLLMGVGPMISWKRSTMRNLRNNLLGPLIFGAVAAALSMVLGLRHWYALGTVVLTGFVLGTLFLEFFRGTRVIRRQKNLPWMAAFFDLILHANRRYGGYIVHVGVLFIFMGIAGTVFQTEADFSVKPGASFDFAGYHLTYREPRIADSEHKMDLVAKVELARDGKKLADLYPARYFYKTTNQPTTEVDMYHAPFKDVYLVLGNIDETTGVADIRVILNPLISFVWLGGLVILLGTVVVLLPRFTRIKPAEALAPLILISLIGLPLPVKAQVEPPAGMHVSSEEQNAVDPFQNRSPDDPSFQKLKNLTEKLLCQCGGCVRTNLRVCTCDFAKRERARIFAMMESGGSDDDIIKSFIGQYGMTVLTAPPEKGFFKVGYLAPGVVLVACLALAGLIIRVWSRRVAVPAARARAPEVTPDDPYARKLSEELKEFES